MAYQVRSKEQLAVMLKLIQVNDVNLTRRNLDVRRKVWQAIAQKLNQMNGAEKDAESWKRSYYTWRINTGTDYQKEIHKIINNVPDDDYFYINLTEDEDESDNAKQISTKNPTERQKARLDELAYNHRQILNSTADDEPLKTQIWHNIAEELNKIPGAMKLTPNEWRQRVDMEKYRARRGRKRIKKISTAKETNENLDTEEGIEFELVGSETMDSQGVESYGQDYGSVGELIQDESEKQSTSTTDTYIQRDDQCSKTGVDFDIDIDALLNDNNDENYDYDDDDVEDDYADNDTEVEYSYKPQSKRIRPSPMVKSFKCSNRIVKSVEKLSNDVNDIKELLVKNSSILELMENVLQQQCMKQEETNALLKRNGQLLKVLVEYKCGKRKKSDNR